MVNPMVNPNFNRRQIPHFPEEVNSTHLVILASKAMRPHAVRKTRSSALTITALAPFKVGAKFDYRHCLSELFTKSLLHMKIFPS